MSFSASPSCIAPPTPRIATIIRLAPEGGLERIGKTRPALPAVKASRLTRTGAAPFKTMSSGSGIRKDGVGFAIQTRIRRAAAAVQAPIGRIHQAPSVVLAQPVTSAPADDLARRRALAQTNSLTIRLAGRSRVSRVRARGTKRPGSSPQPAEPFLVMEHDPIRPRQPSVSRKNML